MVKAKVTVEAEVRPTEDEGKVIQAISNVFEFKELKKEQRGNQIYLIAEGDEESLQKLRELLRRERILDAARRIMLSRKDERHVIFYLHKQAAYVGRVTFCQPTRESPLGPLSFYVETEDSRELINWLAPRTIRGIPVDEL